MGNLEFLIPILVIFTIFYFSTATIKHLLDYGLKKKLINNGDLSGNQQWLFEQKKEQAGMYSNLKYGLILLFVGLGFVFTAQFGLDSPLALGGIIAMAGLGFLLYFYLVRKMLKKEEEEVIFNDESL